MGFEIRSLEDRRDYLVAMFLYDILHYKTEDSNLLNEIKIVVTPRTTCTYHKTFCIENLKKLKNSTSPYKRMILSSSVEDWDGGVRMGISHKNIKYVMYRCNVTPPNQPKWLSSTHSNICKKKT